MIAWRLMAGISQGEGDLRPMTDLMNEDVQEKLAWRHGDALPPDIDLTYGCRRLLAEPTRVVDEILARRVAERKESLDISVHDARLTHNRRFTYQSLQVAPLHKKDVINEATNGGKASLTLCGYVHGFGMSREPLVPLFSLAVGVINQFVGSQVRHNNLPKARSDVLVAGGFR